MLRSQGIEVHAADEGGAPGWIEWWRPDVISGHHAPGRAREQIGDDPRRGYLVANPLGDPLRVNWESMGAARRRPQVNRDEFGTAMERLVAGRGEYLRGRERLAAESAIRFSADACLARHAAVLRAVATGADLPSGDNADATTWVTPAAGNDRGRQARGEEQLT
jgi:hypothetical protein